MVCCTKQRKLNSIDNFATLLGGLNSGQTFIKQCDSACNVGTTVVWKLGKFAMYCDYNIMQINISAFATI